jgi:hypothetical protein
MSDENLPRCTYCDEEMPGERVLNEDGYQFCSSYCVEVARAESATAEAKDWASRYRQAAEQARVDGLKVCGLQLDCTALRRQMGVSEARVAELEAAARAVVDDRGKAGGFWCVPDGAFQDLAALVASPSVGVADRGVEAGVAQTGEKGPVASAGNHEPDRASGEEQRSCKPTVPGSIPGPSLDSPIVWPARQCKSCGSKTRSTSTIDRCVACGDSDGLRPRHFLTADKHDLPRPSDAPPLAVTCHSCGSQRVSMQAVKGLSDFVERRAEILAAQRSNEAQKGCVNPVPVGERRPPWVGATEEDIVKALSRWEEGSRVGVLHQGRVFNVVNVAEDESGEWALFETGEETIASVEEVGPRPDNPRPESTAARPEQVDALYEILEKYSQDSDGKWLAGDRIRVDIITEILGVFPRSETPQTKDEKQ